ncbi:hypothetical protein D3C76_1836080 [compost metagenome]
MLVSDGEEILPEHLDLPDTAPLASLAAQLAQLSSSREPETAAALRQLLENALANLEQPAR